MVGIKRREFDPGSAPPMEVKAYVLLCVYIDDEGDLGYKGTVLLPLISRASNLSISNDLSLVCLNLSMRRL